MPMNRELTAGWDVSVAPRKLRAIMGACVCLLCGAQGVLGQEAINTPAPTQPGAGNWVVREQVRFMWYEDLPNDPGGSVRDMTLLTIIQHGITGSLSAELSLPLIGRQRSADDPAAADGSARGLGDISAGLKLRLWQADTGAVDTMRLSVFGNVEMPTGHDEFSSDSFDPTIGATFMAISGRHGFNQALSWKFTTGDLAEPIGPGESLSDLLKFDSAYLYRLSPAEYTSELRAATYGVVELNGFYETNGDLQVFLSPGILYEAPRFALEAAIQIPVYQDVDHRAESTFGFVLGLRILF